MGCEKGVGGGGGRNQTKKLSGGRYSGISIFQISKENKSREES